VLLACQYSVSAMLDENTASRCLDKVRFFVTIHDIRYEQVSNGANCNILLTISVHVGDITTMLSARDRCFRSSASCSLLWLLLFLLNETTTIFFTTLLN
jgi:hypothetical protein